MAPEAFISNVSTDVSFAFRVDVSASVLNDVEASIVIRDVAGTKVQGAFNWVPNPNTDDTALWLTYVPSAPLSAMTDYLATVSPTGTFAPKWAMAPGLPPGFDGKIRGGFTTGTLCFTR